MLLEATHQPGHFVDSDLITRPGVIPWGESEDSYRTL